jgi:hypothetical protein
MKQHYRYFLYAAVLSAVPAALAQNALDVNLGFGSAYVKAASGGIDNANSLNAFGSCTVGAADPNCQSLPNLSGFFMNIGGDIMFTEKFGAGAQIAFQPATSNYGPLSYRQTFFDGNGLYEPIRNKRYVVQLQGGIGAARTGFSYSASSCVGTAVCSTQSQPVGTASHFQVHVGAAVQVFVTEHIFIKPQFDFHYVPGLTDQFGSNAVPMFMINVGYGTRR